MGELQKLYVAVTKAASCLTRKVTSTPQSPSVLPSLLFLEVEEERKNELLSSFSFNFLYIEDCCKTFQSEQCSYSSVTYATRLYQDSLSISDFHCSPCFNKSKIYHLGFLVYL